MPSDLSTNTPGKRPRVDRTQSNSSIVSHHSDVEPNLLHPQSASHHKSARHRVGHGRGRNLSFGRTLSKINVTAANAAQNEEGPQSARLASDGTPLLSPRHKPAMRRTQTSVALSHKSQSVVSLKKNHSSGNLHRNGSSKHIAKRPDMHRSKTQADKNKQKSPTTEVAEDRQTGVRFDMGDEDDDEEMEGVDDGWTAESASQSPNTTRENTRQNTRQNSVVLDPEENPHRIPDGKPPDRQGSDTIDPSIMQQIVQKDFASVNEVSNSSYQEGNEVRPPDAEAIAKRLLQRSQRTNLPPKVSEISALANASPNDPNQLSTRQSSGPNGMPNGSTPMVSRFIGDSSAPGSSNATPIDTHLVAPRRPSTHQQHDSSDMKRNQSLPNFAAPFSPGQGHVPEATGTTTPGGSMRPSRTQQKLWLQRGLSNVEANTLQNNTGVLAPGRLARGGALLRQYEKVEKELAVVRRHRDPLTDSVERLRRIKLGRAKGSSVTVNDVSPKKNRRSRDGTRTPGGESIKSHTSAPPGGGLRTQVSFALSAPDDDDDDDDDDQPDWQHMTLDEIEEATIDLRRQMWELASPGEAD